MRRCGFRTIAVDLSLDMLKLGATRLGTAAGLVTGDMEALPFADSSFSKACCLNAFHQVPNQIAALREIRRVLTPNGVVFFSEPGAGHAANPTSLAAVRNYGVQENEILIDEFMDACLAAGFVDVRLHPISHVVPLFERNTDQWRAWRTFAASKRPYRAVEKMWRALLEFAGLRKATTLFEEAFAIRLLRELQPIIEQHAVVTAHRARFVKPERVVDCAELEIAETLPSTWTASEVIARVRIRNVGTTTWNRSASDHVRLGVQLLGSDGSVIDRDYLRQDFPGPVLPGGRCELTVWVPRPSSAGAFQLKLDLVREGIHWFEMAGSKTLLHNIEVT